MAAADLLPADCYGTNFRSEVLCSLAHAVAALHSAPIFTETMAHAWQEARSSQQIRFVSVSRTRSIARRVFDEAFGYHALATSFRPMGPTNSGK